MKRILSKHNFVYFRFGLKVGVACALSYFISDLLGSEHAVWAVVSAIVAMQLNVADSLQTGFWRFSATVMGAVAGVALLVLTPKTPLAIGIAVFVATALSGFLTRYSNRFSSASIAAMIVLISGVTDAGAGLSDAALFGFMRVLEISIGVGSALLVSFVLWPVRLTDTLRTDISTQFADSAQILDMMATSFTSSERQVPKESVARLERRAWHNHEQLSKARKHESVLYAYDRDMLQVQVSTLDRTVECFRSMIDAIDEYEQKDHEILMGRELRTLANAIIAAFHHLGSETPDAPAAVIVRNLHDSISQAEARMAQLRNEGATRGFELNRVLQFFTFYQAMRQLTESLLESLNQLEIK